MPHLNNYEPPLIDTLLRFHQVAKVSRLNYAVVGGVAVGVWGKPRMTLDLDAIILLKPAEINNLTRAAQHAGFSANEAEREHLIKSDMFRLRYAITEEYIIRLDFILATHPYYDEVLRRKRPIQIKGRRVPFVSPEDLIILKLLSGRPQDKADIINVVDHAQAKLDLSYLKKWAKRFGLLKQLRTFIK
jgi:predicted nucleotidyltransferase